MIASRVWRRKGLVFLCVAVSLITLAVAAAAATVGGVAFANGDGDTIHGCVTNAGLLRVVDGEHCKHSETPIEWNVQGPPGPSAISTEWRTEYGTISPRDWNTVTSPCESGEVVTGGGYSLGSIGLNDKVNFDGPVPIDGGAQGWAVSVHNDTDYTLEVWVTAICAVGTADPS